MFTSPILRSTISLASNTAKQSAARHVKLTLKPNAVASYAKLYMSRIPVIGQWGLFLGTVMGWPYASAYLIDHVGGLNTVIANF